MQEMIMNDDMFVPIGVVLFIFGILIGSFLNVVIYRIPKNESIVFPSSKCQSCGNSLKWYHNIPIFSWVFLGGKCAFCKDKISAQYPVVEFVTGLIFVAIYMKLGFVWYMPFIALSFTALFALVMIDFKYMAVPDSVNFVALLLALIQPQFIDALLFAIAAAGGLYLVGLLSSVIAKREAMGGADVIVAGTMGALLGFPLFFIAIFLSAILAMIPAMIWKDRGVPFVPFLALATLITYLYDTQAIEMITKVIYG